MYIRQFGYTIMPGHEEQAIGLCAHIADVLRRHGVQAHVLVGGKLGVTLQLVEEYPDLDAMHVARRTLEYDESYRSAVSTWAAQFYPLVRAASPAMVLHDQHVA